MGIDVSNLFGRDVGLFQRFFQAHHDAAPLRVGLGHVVGVRRHSTANELACSAMAMGKGLRNEGWGLTPGLG